jgi:DNA polymerase-3 subunit alpha
MKKRHYKKKRFGPEEYDKIKELIGLANEDDLGGETIQQAKVLEGNLRIHIHACGYHYTK